MNEDYKNELDLELSPEESAEIDRILRETAALDDAEVDYGAILKGVKRKAKAEGLVIFPSKREHGTRRGMLRAALAGAAVAAAVLVVGFGSLALVKKLLPESKAGDVSVFDDQLTETPSNEIRVSKAPSPSASADMVEPVNETAAPSYSAVPDPTEAPVFSEDPYLTPLPTETAMRGGVMGYVLLDSFDIIPDEIREIVPEDLPAFMVTKGMEEPVLEAKSYALVEDTEYLYECRLKSADEIMLLEGESELGIGVAKYSYNEDARTIRYLWRILDSTYLEIEFVGFDRIAAEELLLELTSAAEAAEAA